MLQIFKIYMCLGLKIQVIGGIRQQSSPTKSGALKFCVEPRSLLKEESVS